MYAGRRHLYNYTIYWRTAALPLASTGDNHACTAVCLAAYMLLHRGWLMCSRPWVTRPNWCSCWRMWQPTDIHGGILEQWPPGACLYECLWTSGHIRTQDPPRKEALDSSVCAQQAGHSCACEQLECAATGVSVPDTCQLHCRAGSLAWYGQDEACAFLV
jgi:hypothetical protein